MLLTTVHFLLLQSDGYLKRKLSQNIYAQRAEEIQPPPQKKKKKKKKENLLL